jgi:hypothetical protein
VNGLLVSRGDQSAAFVVPRASSRSRPCALHCAGSESPAHERFRESRASNRTSATATPRSRRSPAPHDDKATIAITWSPSTTSLVLVRSEHAAFRTDRAFATARSLRRAPVADGGSAPCVTELCVRGSSPPRLGGDADSFCSSGHCGREASREVPLCVASAVRRPEGPGACGRPRGRSLAVGRGSQVGLATAPGRGSTVGSCSRHLLSAPPPPCSTRRLHGASASFRSRARIAGHSMAQPGRSSGETACDDLVRCVHGQRKGDRANGHRSQRICRGSHATTSAGAGRRPGAQAAAA